MQKHPASIRTEPVPRLYRMCRDSVGRQWRRWMHDFGLDFKGYVTSLRAFGGGIAFTRSLASKSN